MIKSSNQTISIQEKTGKNHKIICINVKFIAGRTLEIRLSTRAVNNRILTDAYQSMANWRKLPSTPKRLSEFLGFPIRFFSSTP